MVSNGPDHFGFSLAKLGTDLAIYQPSLRRSAVYAAVNFSGASSCLKRGRVVLCVDEFRRRLANVLLHAVSSCCGSPFRKARRPA